jgi:pimeloyl-ACP methyl ester carboxylesterase
MQMNYRITSINRVRKGRAKLGSFALLAIYLFLATGCTRLASVKHTPARYASSGTREHELAIAERELTDASKIEYRQPLLALASDLAAAKIAVNTLEYRRDNTDAQKLYNFAVARSVENIQRAHLQPWRRAINVLRPNREFILTTPRPIDSEHDPSNYTLFLCDSLSLGGKFFETRSGPEGIGAPLVAVGRVGNSQFRQRYELPRVYAPVTAVMKFQGQRAQLEFIEPFVSDRVKIDHHLFSLAANYDAPMAMLLSRERPDKLGFIRLLRPEKYADTARLTRLQPFDPGRTPVIFVHGLQDTPVSWVPMVSALRKDPEIQRRYQLWVFSYPSGYPYPYSAALLRRELDGIARKFPNRKPIVLVGHSMGGMICRLMITDAGDKIWRNVFGKSPAETSLSGKTRALLEDVIVFNHRREVKRVIFISTPHRGAGLASGWIGRTARRLVKAPAFLADARDEVAAIVADDEARLELKQIPNSIDTLSPNNLFVKEVSQLQLSPSIPYHSIIGDRGRGDTPNSSDGVVAYWSSHLDGARSELIVPTNHGAEHSPEGIAEVRRILRESP